MVSFLGVSPGPGAVECGMWTFNSVKHLFIELLLNCVRGTSETHEHYGISAFTLFVRETETCTVINKTD